MRINFLLLILACFINACVHDPGSERISNRSEKTITQKAIAIAEDYATGNVSDANRNVAPGGIVTIGNNQKRYTINPSMICFRLIDDDREIDAIVSLDRFEGQFQVPSEQLIIIKSGRKFILSKAVEADMKVVQIKDRIITAEVPTHTRNSPLFNCSECKEIIHYRFIKGKLERME